MEDMSRVYEGSAWELRRKLDLLISQDPELTTFGANLTSKMPDGSIHQGGHEFKLGDPLSEGELRHFEESHGITLPPHYRAFLKCVGNGGAGPGYGLAELGSGVRRTSKTYGRAYLSTPFEFTQHIGYGGFSEDERPFAEDEGGGCYHGCLYLAHEGCGMYEFLVVTGPCRGQVWMDDCCNDTGIFPMDVNFYFWYDRWLESAFASLYRSKLGLPG